MNINNGTSANMTIKIHLPIYFGQSALDVSKTYATSGQGVFA
jgi:hypothetical protein